MSMLIGDREYVTAEEAALILSERSGRPVGAGSIRKMASQGYLTKTPLDGRTSLYDAEEIRKYKLRIYDRKPRGV